MTALLNYKLLGRSGLRVSDVCLGAMRFRSQAEATRIVGAFAEHGGNFIDTADAYGGSERYVGEAVKPDRDAWVVATKYTLARDRRDPNAAGNHRKSLRHALDASLRRLGTDYVDLLTVHIWDFLSPVEEVMRALSRRSSAPRPRRSRSRGCAGAPASSCRSWAPAPSRSCARASARSTSS